MTETRDLNKTRHNLLRIGLCAVALLAAALVFASSSFAAYEQIGTFGGQPGPNPEENFSEEVQLGGASGLAVNSTGAGGVPAGTIYVIGSSGSETRVSRYNPDGTFSMRWKVGPSYQPIERCGPDVEPSHPPCEAKKAGSTGNYDVEVNQSTGYVYVNWDEQIGAAFAADGAVKVYNPDGTEMIAHFAPYASTEETSKNPEKLGRSTGLAVADDGTVYLGDENPSGILHHRVMVWKPQTPGDFSKYVYTGESHDIAPGGLGKAWPRRPVLDDAGNLYGNQEERIVMYHPDEPTKEICRFNQLDGGVTNITVDPRNGKVFYFDYKDRRVHQLSPCNEATKKFTETGTVKLTPPQRETFALGFDPLRTWSSDRPAGVLYVASAEAEIATNEHALGYILAPPKEIPPTVGGEAVSSVTTSSALLRARINPNSSQTRYVFQYISDAAYQANEPGDRFAGAGEVPAGGALIEGNEIVPVSVAVSGLSADTTYHFRVVATSFCSADDPEQVCGTVGSERELHTYPFEALGLADHRAYELVSPVNKNGGEVVPAYPDIASCIGCKPGTAGFRMGPIFSAPGGDAIAYMGQPFGLQGAVAENNYYATRSSDGWHTTTLSPAAQRQGEAQGFQGMDRSLSNGVLYVTAPFGLPGPDGYANLFRQSMSDPASFTPLVTEAPPNRSASRQVNSFALNYAGASEGASRIFFGANDALTGATGSAPAATDGGQNAFNLYEWTGGGLNLVNVEPGNAEATPGAEFAYKDSDRARAISRDGSRAFWTGADGKTYVRFGGDLTREIPDPSAHYLTAAVDGSRMLMSDGKAYGDLEAETPVEEFDLTEGKGGFEGVAGQSEDLSRIYFVATSVLDETANAVGAAAETGKHNLYSWEEGEVRFIAQLADADGSGSGGRNWSGNPNGRSAEASPAGRWLAFVSSRPLTDQESFGPCTQQSGSEIFAESLCEEVFLYDSASDTLTCPSCNPSGANPKGNSRLRLNAVGANSPLEQPRYLTDSGRLFFDTSDSLVPRDTNGRVEDVYEFEPNGEGTCTRVTGCVSLISTGTSLVDSNFYSMDESGKNAFLTSRDRLVPADVDDLIDLYDAREGGGIPAQSAPPPSECQGEACQAVPSPPIDPTPASSNFEGPGNVKEKVTKKKKHRKHHHRKGRMHGKKHHGGKRTTSNKRGGSK